MSLVITYRIGDQDVEHARTGDACMGRYLTKQAAAQHLGCMATMRDTVTGRTVASAFFRPMEQRHERFNG